MTQGGVGEVEFGTAADALRAISQLSNSSLDGHVITVRCDSFPLKVAGGCGVGRRP